MKENLTLQDLRAMVARAEIDVPEQASELLGHIETSEAVFTQAFEAGELGAMMRDHHLEYQSELARLIEPLHDLPETSVVMLVQVNHGDEVASFMIDSARNVLLAAVYLDHGAAGNDLTMYQLRGLLRRTPSRMTRLALEALQTAPDDVVERVREQFAASTGRTLRTKYGLARERGTEVIGLEEFVEGLPALGSGRVCFCPVLLPTGVVTIALREDRDGVAGVLVVRFADHE